MADSFEHAYSFHDLTQAADAARFLDALDGAERRAIRNGAQLSRKALADRLQVPVARLQAWENGAQPTMDSDEVIKYAGALKALQPPEQMTPEERALVLEYFEKGEACGDCGGVHNRACPRVRSRSYHENGTPKSVDYWPDGQWPQDTVIFRDSPELEE